MAAVRHQDREIEMKAASRYINEHHADWGVALFIVPVLVGAWSMTGIACFVAWVLQ
jgi:hypothetical protein